MPMAVAVSTWGASGSGQREALLLAALVAARTQGSTHIAVDGNLVEIPEGVGLLERYAAGSSASAPSAADCGLSGTSPSQGSPSSITPGSALVSGAELLSRFPADSSGGRKDLLFLCYSPPEEEEVDLTGLVGRLQSDMGFRSLLLHRMRPGGELVVDFRPRIPAGMPSDPSEAVVDVCIVMDLTGSMGAWIDACRTHLIGIMRELQTEATVKHINVAFVGYRDYEDEGRVVVKPFVPVALVEEVRGLVLRPDSLLWHPLPRCASQWFYSSMAFFMIGKRRGKGTGSIPS